MKEYDVVIAGGSIAGLLTAREIAKNGNSVLVLEEGFEIGTPDHCGGLVSKSALYDLGVKPSQKTFDCMINSAEIYSPSGKKIKINSKNQEVVVVNRRELDKQAAYQAQQSGAEIMVKTSFKEKTGDLIRTSNGDIKCKVMIDCRGVSRLVNSNRDGILLSAQYEVYADWIVDGKVEVYFDQIKYPGFFAWIIPSGNGVGKIGVAICYDRHYPEFMRSLGIKGAEVVVIPQAGTVGEWPDGLYEAELQVASFQNGYFCALANRVGREDQLEFAGESFITNPEGKVVAQSPSGVDDILIYEMDLGEVDKSPARKMFFRDRRPDIYPLD